MYARRRMGAGIAAGFVLTGILAGVLGFFLTGDLDWKVRLGATVMSFLVATPALCSLGFAIGLSGRLRRLGMGIVIGSILMTAITAGAFLLI